MEHEYNMTNAELKAYIGRARELEAAVHTQKTLIDEFNKLMEERCPIPPKKREVPEPIKPAKTRLGGRGIIIWLSCLIFVLLGIGIIADLRSGVRIDFDGTLLLESGILLLLAFVVAPIGLCKIPIDCIRANARYKKEMEQYTQASATYSMEAQKAMEENDRAMKEYSEQLKQYNDKNAPAIEKIRRFFTS